MPEPLGLEPLRSRLRPINMLRALMVVVLLVLAGCGSAEQGSSGSKPGSDQESGAAMVGGCAADSAQVTDAKTVATVDLDGDGTAEAVKLTTPGGECNSTLFAKLGEGYVASAVPADPPVTGAFGVDLGSSGGLVVTKADHPRGGYQLRVYAAGTDKLAELQVDGQSLLPFVATDVQEHPFSIECADGGLVLTEAVAHEPIGVVPAWDIKRTTYVVDGTSVQKGATAEVADNVLTNQLAAKYPDLVKHAAFTTCRS
jgi:hypothetical protein